MIQLSKAEVEGYINGGFKNMCKKCFSVNTIWPFWIGRKRVYRCEICGNLGRGTTPNINAKREKK